MGSNIQPLPTEVVHLMAAGEVIDSLAAVVRELVENALDAGATRITVAVWAEQWRVRVTDNGSGMRLADLQQAAAPHATSKIRDRADLLAIHSLGFRGEALHSLAQLADLEIFSHCPSESQGWRLRYNAQGEPIQIETAAIAPGTIVLADNLFANWSARRQGLPSSAQQLRAIQLTLHHMALAHPEVTWQIQQADRDWFQLWAGKTAKQVLPQILRDVQEEDFQEITLSLSHPTEEEAGISGVEVTASGANSKRYLLLGLPDRCHRHRPDWIKVAINGRFVRLPELEQAIISAFRRMVPRDRYPIAYLHLQVPPDQIDWNRHPAKSEIYLHHLETWKNQVIAAIHQALSLGPATVTSSLYSERVGNLLKTAEAEAGYGASRDLSALPTEAQLPLPLTSLKALAQVHNTYILAEHPTGLWLVEQHIAHERVLYEQVCDRWQLVPLDPPLILPQLTAAQQEQLQRLGIAVDPFGEDLWAVRAAPELLAQRADCAAALQELSQGGDLQTAQVATACRSAIRNGTPLTLGEMQTLLDRWQQTRNPRTCPHGRPIYLPLEESSLSRFFRRHWVIGKSHGI
jgi:DNA mismatch repair protein MutL